MHLAICLLQIKELGQNYLGYSVFGMARIGLLHHSCLLSRAIVAKIWKMRKKRQYQGYSLNRRGETREIEQKCSMHLSEIMTAIDPADVATMELLSLKKPFLCRWPNSSVGARGCPSFSSGSREENKR